MARDICVLVVEDDQALRRALAATLAAAAYRVVEVGSNAEARRMMAHHRPDLVLLDLGLPDGDGLGFIEAMRAESLTPIVVITARDAEAMKVAALDAGADDYVTKPFGVDELLARLRAALRHAVQASGSAPLVRTGALVVDLAGHAVTFDGVRVDLTPREFDILAVLASHLGKVVRHQDLLKAVWGSSRTDVQYLRVFVSQLRAKMDVDAAGRRYIVSEPGVGYRLADHLVEPDGRDVRP